MQGESLSDEEKDKEEDEEEKEEAEDNDDDGFFVGHGVLGKDEIHPGKDRLKQGTLTEGGSITVQLTSCLTGLD